MENTQLSTSVTVKKYRNLQADGRWDEIADFIYERFRERYLEPFENNSAKHGFAMMAIGCLMIEALHSFRKGWKRTGGKGGEAFEEFFANSKYLTDFSDIGHDFYSSVRCGILHQAETYNGWKILRKGALVDKSNKTLNATRFLKSLDKELKHYTDELKSSPNGSDIWKKTIRKLDHMCANSNA
jgi:hypothetical protein